MMRLEFSEPAEHDLENIYIYGAETFGMAQADVYMSGLRRLFDTLRDNPMVGRERDEVRPPIRLFPYEAHHVFYDVFADRVMVQRVLHRTVDWMAGL
jgi:toxin ParE1/3/4